MSVHEKWYELCDALYEGDFSVAQKLVVKYEGLMDERNTIGETVLHYLAVENCLTGIIWLHERGCSLNTTNKYGTPLLFEVAQLGYRELYSSLCDMGADESLRNEEGESVVEYLRDQFCGIEADYIESKQKR